MKKLLFLFIATVMTVAVFAQTSTTPTINRQSISAMLHQDGVFKKDDKLFVVQSGQTSILNHDVTLVNGATVTKEGAIKMPDGKITKLKNGDCVKMDVTGCDIMSLSGYDDSDKPSDNLQRVDSVK